MDNPKKAPVFCGGCRHYLSGFSDRVYEHCAAEVAKPARTVRTYYSPAQVCEPRTPAEKNRHNDCADWEAHGR